MLDWKTHGPIYIACERLFYLLQRISLAAHPGQGVRYDLAKQKSKTVRNDLYIIAILILEAAACLFVIANWPSRIAAVHCCMAPLITLLACIRIADIVQAAVNTILFDAVREGGTKQQTILSVRRKLLLESINYIEIIVLFGLIYYCMPEQFINHSNNIDYFKHWIDPFYFSAITQLTVGYGDMTLVGFAKVLAMMQAVIGFFFGLLVLARTVATLPRTHDLSVQGIAPNPNDVSYQEKSRNSEEK